MSASREAIQQRLQAAIPGFGARQGSQTLNVLANRNNISRAAIEVYAEAAKRAELQQRELAKLEARRIEEQRELERFQANVQREATAQYEAAISSVGDDRTRSVLAQNGTLSNQVRTNLNAQLQNLRASGEHVDKQGNLTFQAASLQAALGEADRLASNDLNSRFGGDETARAAATQQAERNLTAGPIDNFVTGAVNATGRNLVGLPAQITSAIAGDTALGRGAGRLAARVQQISDRNDIVTPEEQQFRDEFAESDGFLGGLSTILQNPGQALQSFGPDVAGGLGAGQALRVGGRAVARRAAPEATERLSQGLANANTFTRASAATAPAVFAAGGGEFAQGAQQALDSDTDNIGSFARRGLGVSALETVASGGVGALGGATLDAPLFRARQALREPLPDAAGTLSRVGRFGRTVGSEGLRGAAGEGFVEGLAGGAQDISAQVGEGTSLAELDLNRTAQAAGQGAAAGVALGGAVSAATGTGTTLRRKTAEDQLRSELNQATGSGTEQGVRRDTPGLDSLNRDEIDTTVGQLQSAPAEQQVAFVLQVAKDLGINSTNVTFDNAGNLFNQATVGDTIDSGLFRTALGNLLGANLTTDEAGNAIRGADIEPQVEPEAGAAGVIDDVDRAQIIGDDAVADDQLDLLNDAGPADVAAGVEPEIDPLQPAARADETDGGLADTQVPNTETDEGLGEPVLPQAQAQAAPVLDETTPDNSDQQVVDPAVSQPGATGVLDDATEALFGDLSSVQALRASNDGSPRAQADEDFELNLLRDQFRGGLRDATTTQQASQIEIARRLNEINDNAGIRDPEQRRLADNENRETVREAFRADRAAAVAANAANFQPVEQAPADTTPTTDLGTEANNFVRDTGELNVITNDADPDNALLPEPLRLAIFSTYSPSRIRETLGKAGVAEGDRGAIRDGLLNASDLKQESDLSAVRQILRRVRDSIGKVYSVDRNQYYSGEGSVRLKRKGTEASRTAAVQKLRENIPEELAKVQNLMTPEGYQRVFGKKR